MYSFTISQRDQRWILEMVRGERRLDVRYLLGARRRIKRRLFDINGMIFEDPGNVSHRENQAELQKILSFCEMLIDFKKEHEENEDEVD